MRRYCCRNGSGSQQRSESELKELVPSHLLAPLPHARGTCAPHLPPNTATWPNILHATGLHALHTLPWHQIWPALLNFCMPAATSGGWMWKRRGWTLHCVGAEPFLGGPHLQITSCLRALQESPQRPFGEPQTSNMVGAFSKFFK